MLPDVGSTIVPPGFSRPSRSAASIIATATRSFTLPPGLIDLDLGEQVAAQALGLASSRDSRTSGVLPTRSRSESATSIASTARASPERGPVIASTLLAAMGARRGRSAGGIRVRARIASRSTSCGSTNVPAPRPQAVATSSVAATEQRRGRLHARAGRDVLGRVRHEHRPARRGRRAPAGTHAGPRAAADEHEPAVGAARRPPASASRPSSRPHTTPSNAARASCCARDVGAQPGDRARSRRGGSARARRRSTARARRRRRRRRPRAPASSSPCVVDAEQPRDRIGHLRRVQRAHEREEAAGRVGEAGDRAGRVGGRRVAHREHGARRAERDDDVAGPQRRCRARRPCCRRCPARRSRRRPNAVGGAGGLGRAEHARAAALASRASPSTIARRSSAVLARRPRRSSRCRTRRRDR